MNYILCHKDIYPLSIHRRLQSYLQSAVIGLQSIGRHFAPSKTDCYNIRQVPPFMTDGRDRSEHWAAAAAARLG